MFESASGARKIKVNRGIWEAAVPDEFGSVSVCVNNVRDVVGVKPYAKMCMCVTIVRVLRGIQIVCRVFGGFCASGDANITCFFERIRGGAGCFKNTRGVLEVKQNAKCFCFVC